MCLRVQLLLHITTWMGRGRQTDQQGKQGDETTVCLLVPQQHNHLEWWSRGKGAKWGTPHQAQQLMWHVASSPRWWRTGRAQARGARHAQELTWHVASSPRWWRTGRARARGAGKRWKQSSPLRRLRTRRTAGRRLGSRAAWPRTGASCLQGEERKGKERKGEEGKGKKRECKRTAEPWDGKRAAGRARTGGRRTPQQHQGPRADACKPQPTPQGKATVPRAHVQPPRRCCMWPRKTPQVHVEPLPPQQKAAAAAQTRALCDPQPPRRKATAAPPTRGARATAASLLYVASRDATRVIMSVETVG